MRLTSWLELFRYRLNWRSWFLRTHPRSRRRKPVMRHAPEIMEERILLTDITWTRDVAGTWQWNDTSNWSTGQVPGTGDVAIFTNTQDLTIQGAVSALKLEIQGSGDLHFTDDISAPIVQSSTSSGFLTFDGMVQTTSTVYVEQGVFHGSVNAAIVDVGIATFNDTVMAASLIRGGAGTVFNAPISADTVSQSLPNTSPLQINQHVTARNVTDVELLAGATFTGTVPIAALSYLTSGNFSAGGTLRLSNSIVSSTAVLTVDDLRISGNSTIDVNMSVSDLNVTGTLLGAGNISVVDSLTFDAQTGGSTSEISGTGSLSVGATAPVSFTGWGKKVLGRDLTVSGGTFSWTDFSEIEIQSGVTLTLPSTGLTVSPANSVNTFLVSGAGSLVNSGPLVKNGPGSLDIDVDYTGTLTGGVGLQVNEGHVYLSSGEIQGDIYIVNGSTTDVIFDGATGAFDVFGDFQGTERVIVSGGELHIADGTSLFRLTVENGGLVVANGLTVSNILTWRDGTLRSNGFNDVLTIPTAGTLYVDTSGTHTLDGYQLSNQGLVSWRGSGTAYLENGAKIQNDAQFEITGSGLIATTSSGTIVNPGTIWKKSGGAVLDVEVTVNNTGIIDIDYGILELGAGWTTVPVDIAPGAGLVFDKSGATFNLMTGATLGGGGSITVKSGVLYVYQSQTWSDFTLSGGTLTGATDVTINGVMNWSGGNMTGIGGKTTLAPSAILNYSGTALHVLSQRTLEIMGQASASGGPDATVNWSGTGTLRLQSNAQLNNYGVMNLNAAGFIQDSTGFGVGTILNEGVINKSADAGQFRIYSDITHNGTANISAGSLRFYQGDVHGEISPTTGAFTAAGTGYTLNIHAGAVFSGTGNVFVDSGEVALLAPTSMPRLYFQGGTISGSGLTVNQYMSWSAGSFQSSGSSGLTMPAGSTLFYSGTANRSITGGAAENYGQFIWDSTSTLTLAGAATLTNNLGATLEVRDDGWIDAGTGGGQFNNNGLIQKTDGPSQFRVYAPTQHTGTIDVDSGSFRVYQGTLNGTIDVASGAAFTAAGSGYTLHSASSAQYLGMGNVVVDSGTFVLDADTTIPRFQLLGGTLDGVGNLTISQYGRWEGGTIQGVGSGSGGGSGTGGGSSWPKLSVGPGATFDFAGGNTHTLTDRDIENFGTWYWQGNGNLAFTNVDNVLTNNGTISLTTDALLSNGQFGVGDFVNNGTLNLLDYILDTGTHFSNTGTITTSLTTPLGPGDGRIATSGDVNLSGTLEIIQGPLGTTAETFTFIDNRGAMPVSGTFSTLVNGQQYDVSYTGGDGNDVTLTARNDAPTVALTQTVSSISENAPPASDTVVGTIAVSDDLVGTYTLTVDDSRFVISGTDLLLKAGVSFNHEAETNGEVVVTVTVQDPALPPGTANTDSITIQILDVNEPPGLDDFTTSDLDENSAEDTVVATLAANDPDVGQHLTYEILSGNTGNAFKIVPNLDNVTAEIKVNDPSALDFETNPVFVLHVRVTDNGMPILNGEADVTINLVNINDAPTSNLGPALNLLRAENNVVDPVVTGGWGSDEDVDPVVQNLTYSFDYDPLVDVFDPNTLFVIDQNSGQVTVKSGAVLDFETIPNSFEFTIQVTDDGSPNLSASTVVTVQLTDVNEAPVSVNHTLSAVEDQPYVFSTADFNAAFSDVDAGDSLAAVRLIDPATIAGGKFEFDDGVNGWQQLTITTDILASELGQLRFVPDQDVNGNITFEFAVLDSGSLVSNSSTMTMDVQPVDDPPVAVNSTVTADEDVEFVFGTTDFAFNDVDGDAIEQVRIDSVTGAGTLEYNGLAVTTPLEIPVANLNLLTFVSDQDDSGPNYASLDFSVQTNSVWSTSSATMTINVDPINDAPTVTAPATQVLNEDADFTAIPGISFGDVDANSSEVRLTAFVSNGELSWTASAGITVESSTLSSVTLLGSISDLNVAFGLNSLSLAYKPNKDFDQQDQLQLTLNDQGAGPVNSDPGPLSGSATVILDILPINDAPTFKTLVAPTIDEDVQTAITGIEIEDADAGDNDVLIQLSVQHGTLVLDGLINGIVTYAPGNKSLAYTGMIAEFNSLVSAGEFKYTTDDNYDMSDTLDIVVNDNGHYGADPGLTGGPADEQASAQLTINIQAVNDAPTITWSTLPTVVEDTPTVLSGIVVGDIDAGSTGELKLTITVVDTDDMNNGVLTINDSIPGITVVENPESSNNSPSVQILGTLTDLQALLGTADGVTYTPGLNFEDTATISLTLNDQGASGAVLTPMESILDVALDVQPVNDAPVIVNTPYTFSIDENPVNGTVVGTITYTDPDANDSATVTLSAVGGGPQPFSAGPITALGNKTYSFDLIVADGDAIDSDPPISLTNIQIDVTVTDAGTNGPADSDAETVTVTIDPRNESPVFPSPPQEIDIFENQPAGTSFGEIEVDDPEGGIGLQYTLISSLFELTLGNQIQLKSGVSLDHETQPQHVLDVIVDDGVNPPVSGQVIINVQDVPEPAIISVAYAATGGAVVDNATVTDFGSVLITNGENTVAFSITNHGNDPLVLSNLTFPNGFRLPTGDPGINGVSVAAGDSVQLQVTFDPDAVQSYPGNVTFDTTDSNHSPFTIKVTGTGIDVAPVMNVSIGGAQIGSSNYLDFGSTIQGFSVTRTITITNSGDAPLSLTNQSTLTGFTINGDLATAIGINESRIFEIVLTATASGFFSELLTLSNPIVGAFDINLVGDVKPQSVNGDGRVTIIDNGDLEFSQTGTWETKLNAGYGGDIQVSQKENASASTAKWSFTGLSTGLYRVSTTWDRDAGDYTGDFFAIAPFTISDGTTSLETTNVNQHRWYGHPTSFVEDQTWWEDLGLVYVDSTSLEVELHAAPHLNNRVIADAVRIELLAPNSDLIFVQQGLREVTFDPTANDQFPRTGDKQWVVEVGASGALNGSELFVNADGTVTVTLPVGVSADEFQYRLALKSDPQVKTEFTTALVAAASQEVIYRDDAYSVSHAHPIQFDVRANDQLFTPLTSIPSFTSVTDGRLVANQDVLDVIDNGFHIGTNATTFTLTIDGVDYDWNSGNIANVLNGQFDTQGVPYRARSVDLSHGVAKDVLTSGFYVQLLNVDTTFSVTTDGSLTENIKRGRLVVDEKGIATYTPDGEFFKLFGEYEERFTYSYAPTENLGIPGTATIRVTNSAPVAEVPIDVLLEGTGTTGFVYFNVPVHITDTDSAGLLEYVEAESSSGLVTHGEQVVLDPTSLLPFRFSLSNTNRDDAIYYWITDGYSYSTLQHTRFVDPNNGSTTSLPLSSFAKPMVVKGNNLSPTLTITANDASGGLGESTRESFGDIEVDLADGSLHYGQSLDTDHLATDLGGFGLQYSSRTTVERPIINVTVTRATTGGSAHIRARLYWHKVSPGGNVGPSPNNHFVEKDFSIDAGLNQVSFAMQPGDLNLSTGLYQWTLVVGEINGLGLEVDGSVQIAKGNKVVVNNRNTDTTTNPFLGFGDGWSFAGVPRLVVEQFGSQSYQDWMDDRAILVLPDGDYRLFTPGGGSSNSNEDGWIAVDADGRTLARRELGALSRTTDGSAWTYVDESGVKFVFEPNGSNLSSLVLKEIIPLSGPSTTIQYLTDGRIDVVTSVDGSLTKFIYDGDNLLDEIQLFTSGAATPTKTIDVTMDTVLDRPIVTQLSQGSTLGIDWTQRFGYAQQTELLLERMDQDVATISIDGHEITFDDINTVSSQSIKDAIVAVWSGFADLEVELVTGTSESEGGNHFEDLDSAIEPRKYIRLVFTGNLAGQSHSVAPTSRATIWSTAFMMSSHTWGADVNNPERLDVITYDGHGLVSSVLKGDALKYDPVLIQSTAAQRLSGTGQPVRATITYPTDTLNKLTYTSPISQNFTAFGETVTVAYELDVFGRTTSRESFVGDSVVPLSSESWQRDHFGNVVRYTDELGRITAFTYDYTDASKHYHDTDLNPLVDSLWHGAQLPDTNVSPFIHGGLHGRATEVFHFAPVSRTKYESEYGLVIQITDALGRSTYFERDVDTGLVTTILGPGNSEERFTYTVDGNGKFDQLMKSKLLVFEQDGDDNTDFEYLVTTYTYDQRNIDVVSTTGYWLNPETGLQTTQTRWQDFDYDTFGNVNSITDNAGNVTSYSNDSLGRVLTETIQWNHDNTLTTQSTNTYSYFDDGLIETVQDGRNILTTYDYDTRGALVEMKEAVALGVEQATVYDYYRNGLAKSVQSPTGVTTEFYYDPENFKNWTRTNGVQNDGTTGIFQYYEVVTETADKRGRSLTTRNELTGQEIFLTYDAYDRVASTTSLVGLSPVGRTPVVSAIQFDFFGNVTQSDAPGRTPVQNQYDYRDRLVSTKVLSTGAEGALPGAFVYFGYDRANNLISSTERRYRPDLENANDPSEVTGWSISAYKTSFDYSAFGEVVSTDVPAETGSTQSIFVFDAIGNLQSSTDRFDLTTTYVTDVLGRVREQVNPNGGVAKYDFDLAGNLIEQTITMGSNGQFRRTTTEYDPLNRVQRTVAHKTLMGTDEADIIVDTTYTVGGTAHGVTAVHQSLPFERTADVNAASGAAPVSDSFFDSRGQAVRVEAPDPDINDANILPLITDFHYQYVPTEASIVVDTIQRNAVNTSDRTSRVVVNTEGMVIEQYRAAYDMTIPVLEMSNFYDEAGRLAYTQDGDNNTVYYSYDEVTGLLTETTTSTLNAGSPSGRTTNYIYDSSGNQVRVIETRGGSPASSTNPATKEWTDRVYDGLGRIIFESTKISASETATRRWKYDGLTTIYKDRNGEVIRVTIDPSTRTSVEDWFTSDSYPLLVDSAPQNDPSPTRRFVTEFNEVGQMVSVKDGTPGMGATDLATTLSNVTFDYDEFGRRKLETQSSVVNSSATPLVTLDSQYHVLGVRSQLDTSLGAQPTLLSSLNYEVDRIGRITDVIQDNAEGGVALWAVPSGLLPSKGADKNVVITYFTDGNRQSISRFHTSSGASRGVSTLVPSPNGSPGEVHHYRDAGLQADDLISEHKNFFSQTTGRLMTAQFEYRDNAIDPNDNTPMATPIPALGSTLTYQYDETGSIKTVTDQNDKILEDHTYDGVGNRIDKDGTEPETIIGNHDRLLQDANAEYRYDTAGRLEQVIRRPLATYDVDTGPVTDVVDAQYVAGLWVDEPDGSGGIRKRGSSTAGSDVIAKITFENLKLGDYELWVKWIPDGTLGVVDISGGQLDDAHTPIRIVDQQQVFVDQSAAFHPNDASYPEYLEDESGQVWLRLFSISMTQEVQNSSDSEKIQLIVRSAGQSPIVDGVMLTSKDFASEYRTDYSWDQRGRLASATFFPNADSDPSQHVQFTYDGLNRRTSATVETWNGSAWSTTSATSFAYDGGERLLELDLMDSGKVVRQYLNDPTGPGILAMDQESQVATANGVREVWAFNDLSGSVITWGTAEEIVDPNGNYTGWEFQHVRYDSFGNIIAQDGSDSHLTAAPHVWNGHFEDSLTGLFDEQQMGWYAPQIGRYLKDNGGTNGYRAHGNNPSNVVQPGINWSKLEGPGPFSGIFTGATAKAHYYPAKWLGLEDELASMTDSQLGILAGIEVLLTYGAIEYVGGVELLIEGISGLGVYGLAGMGAGTALGYLQVKADELNTGRAAPWSDYVFYMGVESLMGGFAPWSTINALEFGAYGMAVEGVATGQVSGRGFQIGSTIGGIFGTAADDIAFRGASRLHALGQASFVAGGATAVGVATYYGGGRDLDRAMFAANLSVLPLSLLAPKVIPCFPAGTPILTPDGTTSIEELQAGDLVLSRDEHDVNGEVAPQVIEETFVRHGEIYELKIGGRVIRVTPEHPLFVDGRGWTPAGEVVAGDRLATIHLPVGALVEVPETANSATEDVQPSTFDLQPSTWESDWLDVESNAPTGEFTTVYNFRVANWHTYFVGDDEWGLWVHNAGAQYLEINDPLVGIARRIADVEVGPMRNRRTIAILEATNGKQVVRFVAGGTTDLSPAQRRLAERLGLTIIDDLPGYHAEERVIFGAESLGFTRVRGATSNIVCPSCRSWIEESLNGNVGNRVFNF
ncbi:MAG: cadherin domain-containing protein [Planctomycetaceae bacterium]